MSCRNVSKSVEFPLGVHAEVLGEFAERQAAQSRLFLFAAVAVIGIFLILLASFGSWRLATLAFVTLPMALVGGVLAANYIGGGIISIGSLVGFFTVLGIVARNGIMMVSHYKHLEDHEGMTFGPELVARGSRERLAPILMTALTTGLALVPLVLSGNLPGSGDRVSDGHRDPRRAHHDDPAQPLRPPVPLPAVREVEPLRRARCGPVPPAARMNTEGRTPASLRWPVRGSRRS